MRLALGRHRQALSPAALAGTPRNPVALTPSARCPGAHRPAEGPQQQRRQFMENLCSDAVGVG